MEKLKSRKFWLAIIGAIIPVINQELSLNLDSETIIAIIGLFGVAIAGLAHVDGKKAAAQTFTGGNGGAIDAQRSNPIGSDK